MFGWFGSKDWNIVAILFEKATLYRANGNRAKGGDAPKARDAVKSHDRTIAWAVFDQKGAYLEGGAGPGAHAVSAEVAAQLVRDLPRLPIVTGILQELETGKSTKVAKALAASDAVVKPTS